MSRGDVTLGTVIRWDDRQQRGLIEGPGLPTNCWVDAAVVHRTSGEGLRAGQVVEVDWAEPSHPGAPRRITRVIPRDELQTPGG